MYKRFKTDARKFNFCRLPFAINVMLNAYEIIITISIENRIKSNTNFGHVLRAIFTRECNETSIAGARKHSLTHSLDFVNYFIYGNYNVS